MEKSAEAFRTISEVAQDLDLPQHVLRFWETRFVQIRPLKRGGGRRYYRPEDVDLLRAIRRLLYGEGYTIKGVQKILKEQGPRGVAAAYGGEGALAPIPAEAALQAYDEGPDATDDALVGGQDAIDSGSNRGPSSGVTAGRDDSWTAAYQNGAPAAARAGGAPNFSGRQGQAHGTDGQLLQELLTELVECARILDAARGG
ncbi:MAG: MerR family transcriptional regulator [Methylovirgula sp.]